MRQVQEQDKNRITVVCLTFSANKFPMRVNQFIRSDGKWSVAPESLDIKCEGLENYKASVILPDASILLVLKTFFRFLSSELVPLKDIKITDSLQGAFHIDSFTTGIEKTFVMACAVELYKIDG